MRPGDVFSAAALGLLLASGTHAEAAAKPVVHWQVKSAPTKPVKAGAAFSVVITGVPDPGWHLYALQEPDGGPFATEIALAEGDPADLLRVDESRPKVLPDANFQRPTEFFDGPADFTLHLRAFKDNGGNTTGLRVLVRYQSCNDRVCLPPHTETIPVALQIGH